MIVSSLQRPQPSEVPYATDDNLIERAEQLFDAGHPIPAAMTCRVAIELRLKALCHATDRKFHPGRGGVTAAIANLRFHRIASRHFVTQLQKAMKTANAVAHGDLVTIQQVDRLLSATRIVDETLQSVTLSELVREDQDEDQWGAASAILDDQIDPVYHRYDNSQEGSAEAILQAIRDELGLAHTKKERVNPNSDNAPFLDVPCLSVRQPWAHLIMAERKPVENRTWRTHYRGPLAIHASTTIKHFERDRKALSLTGHCSPVKLPFGYLLGVVRLVDVIHYDDLPKNSALRESPLVTGPWCWILDNVWQCSLEHNCVRGRLGLFPVRIPTCNLKRGGKRHKNPKPAKTLK